MTVSVSVKARNRPSGGYCGGLTNRQRTSFLCVTHVACDRRVAKSWKYRRKCFTALSRSRAGIRDGVRGIALSPYVQTVVAGGSYMFLQGTARSRRLRICFVVSVRLVAVEVYGPRARDSRPYVGATVQGHENGLLRKKLPVRSRVLARSYESSVIKWQPAVQLRAATKTACPARSAPGPPAGSDPESERISVQLTRQHRTKVFVSAHRAHVATTSVFAIEHPKIRLSQSNGQHEEPTPGISGRSLRK